MLNPTFQNPVSRTGDPRASSSRTTSITTRLFRCLVLCLPQARIARTGRPAVDPSSPMRGSWMPTIARHLVPGRAVRKQVDDNCCFLVLSHKMAFGHLTDDAVRHNVRGKTSPVLVQWKLSRDNFRVEQLEERMDFISPPFADRTQASRDPL